MYVLVLVVLTTFGQVQAKPIGKANTLQLCEEAKTAVLVSKPSKISADAVCIKVEVI